KEKLSLQETFGRFTGDFLTRRALQGGVAMEGERREITVLFTDLRGFTTLSEKLSPQQLVELINEHFQMSVDVIEKNGGHVNKFIGDAVFAIFGAPDRNPWHRLDAVRAALALRAALRETNARRERENRPTLKMGIGLHAGEAVVGLIGSRTRAEFTAMGDTVNVASRLESMCKERNADLLISGAVAESLDASFGAVELEPAQVRGRAEPVRLFTIRA
ncbi:MAG: adenylate/guanylate cyclase domain-containing protein, partial [Candidatus Omnitrophica bacterium]|nr:adenylate/guanylate cyclase domain-containing protein [Candidatus Omnitrophota bacterium]